MSTTTTDVYAEASLGLSHFFKSRAAPVEDWEDLFHDAFARYLENGTPDMSGWSSRDRSGYFIRSVLNAHIRRGEVKGREVDAARSRYLNEPYTSPRYRMDGELVLAIRRLHERGFTTTTLARAARLSRHSVASMIAGRTYKWVV